MAQSQSQRLRRMAQKALRRKVVLAEKRRAESATMSGRDARQIGDASRAPVRTCLMSETLFEEGIGWVVLARTLPSGLVGASFFLVDAWCLGVKDAFFRAISRLTFEEQMGELRQERALVEVDPSVARKVLHDAAAFAGSFGLAPCTDFAEAEALFGDIPLATETFRFGKDGKPFYISGPNDSPARIRHIMDTLAKCAGRGEFNYLVAADDFA
jgi:hypothetical protein